MKGRIMNDNKKIDQFVDMLIKKYEEQEMQKDITANQSYEAQADMITVHQTNTTLH